ncbi:DinB family protein [Streptomyces chartreusis]
MTTDTPRTLPDGRPIPLMTGDERAMLESWLDFHRATLELKCAGLDDAQVRSAAAGPSELTLLGLVQHLAECERNWFQRAAGGVELPPVYGEGNVSGYGLEPGRGIREALDIWRREIARGREVCAGRSLESVGRIGDGPMAGAEVSLRWVFVHMIEEYARHNGHADILREHIDGVTGA